jgi:hypothetical protein
MLKRDISIITWSKLTHNFSKNVFCRVSYKLLNLFDAGLNYASASHVNEHLDPNKVFTCPIKFLSFYRMALWVYRLGYGLDD